MAQVINITAIVADPLLQPRAAMDMALVMEYAGEMQAGAEFPPVVAFGSVDKCWLADGFHRFEAAKQSQFSVIPVDLRPGNRREAQLYSVGANAAHGLRRTNADKRRAVELLLNDPEWQGWSDREIAQRCAVSAPLVGQIRGELGVRSEERRVQRGSVVYTMQTGGIGAKPQSDAQEFMDMARLHGADYIDAAAAIQDEASADEDLPGGPDGGFTSGEDEEGDGFGAGYVARAQAEAAAAASAPVVKPDWGAKLTPPVKAQAIPAPTLPAPTPSAAAQPVVVLTARITEETVSVSVGYEGKGPRVFKRAPREDMNATILAAMADFSGYA